MKKHVIALTALQRAELCLEARSGQAAARRVLRAKILLKADANGEGCSDQEIAEALAVGVATVERVRRRFVEEGSTALDRRPQPPRPQKKRLDGKGEARLVMLACSKPPQGRDHWTMELLAGRMVKLRHVGKLSAETVRRTLTKT